MKTWKRNVAALAGVVVIGIAAPAYADPAPDTGYGSGRGMGPGMMGGHGSGMMGRGAVSPGMMHGNGAGMPGGHGMGPGMMGGQGMELGMMLYGLDLSEEQRTRLEPIHDEMFRKQWDITGKMIEAQRKLRSLMSKDTRDSKAIANAYRNLQELRQQKFLTSLETQEKVEGILSKEQREQFRLRRQGCMG